MEWSWPIFYVSIAIAIAYSMFGPVAKSAQNIDILDIYEKNQVIKVNLILSWLGGVGAGVISAAIITAVICFFEINLILLSKANL